MHELSVCRALLSQVVQIAREHAGSRLARIVVKVGPLSGVVPALLRQVFAVARAAGPDRCPRTPVGPCMVSDEGACRIRWAGGVRAGQPA